MKLVNTNGAVFAKSHYPGTLNQLQLLFVFFPIKHFLVSSLILLAPPRYHDMIVPGINYKLNIIKPSISVNVRTCHGFMG